MAVHSIKIVAADGNDSSPLVDPYIRQDKRIELGQRIPQTDQQPHSLWLALHGTAADTVVVALWWTPDSPREVSVADQRWFEVQGNVTVTVGAVTRINAMPGFCAIQIATTSTNDSELLLVVGSEPVVVS